MAKIVAIVNQKGGVGKTTTATNLSAALGKSGKRILLIDIDPQGSSSASLIQPELITKTCFDWIIKGERFEHCVIRSVIAGVDLMPSRFEIALLDIAADSISREQGNKNVLRSQIDAVKDTYDFVIIDCSPALGILNKNALMAADSVIIPLQTELFAMDGIAQLLAIIRFIQKISNPTLHIEGVLITMFDKRLTVAAEQAVQINKTFGDKVYKTMIPRDTSVSKSQLERRSLFDYDPWCPSALAYAKLAREFLDSNQRERNVLQIKGQEPHAD